MNMKKIVLCLGLYLLCLRIGWGQNTSLYFGRASNQAQLLGVTFHNEVLDYLLFQIDVWKYLNKDQALVTNDVFTDRGDFLSFSGTVALKLPIHLIPYLEMLELFQPYVLSGYGFGVESINLDYLFASDSETENNFLTKLRGYKSFGLGCFIMVSSRFGIQIDYRTISIASQEKMGWPNREFKRISVGAVFGSDKKKTVKK